MEKNKTKIFTLANNCYILYLKIPEGDEYHLYEGAMNKGLLSSHEAISMILKSKAQRTKNVDRV